MSIKETSPQVSGSRKSNWEQDSTVPQGLQKTTPWNPTKWDSQDNEKNWGWQHFPPKIKTSQIKERFVRDEITNELWMRLLSTIFPKRKKEMLYVPLDFEFGFTKAAIVDSGAYVSAITHSDLHIFKQQAPANTFKIEYLPNFQIHFANGQLRKPIATAT